ncbi:MAG: hypothetical protein V3R11_01470 [Nitrospirales bacterium]
MLSPCPIGLIAEGQGGKVFKGGLVIKGRHVADSEEADLTAAVWVKRME